MASGLVSAIRADLGCGSRHPCDPAVGTRRHEEAHVEGLDAGADDYLVVRLLRELLARVRSNLQNWRACDLPREPLDQIREEARRLELLNYTGTTIAAELDLDRLVQAVTDAAVELTGAKFGAFFYNGLDDSGESYTLRALAGAPREAFADFPMPRNTKVFEPTFRGQGIVRSGRHHAGPALWQELAISRQTGRSRLPVRSYPAVLVVSAPWGACWADCSSVIRTPMSSTLATKLDRQRHRGAGSDRHRQRAPVSRQPAGAGRTACDRSTKRFEQRVADEITERMRTEEASRQAQKMEAVGQLTGGTA